MSGYKQAAVALHALDSMDRDLILAEIPEAEQKILRAHLQELSDLGFGGANEDVKNSDLDNMDENPNVVDFLRNLNAKTMFDLLDPEPPGLVAQFLKLQEWPWQAEFFNLCVPVRRDQIKSAMIVVKPAVELRTQLMEIVALQVRSLPPTKSSRSTSFAWINWLKKWIR